MNEDVHIDRIAEAGAAWEAAVRSYVRTWARPAEDGVVTPPSGRRRRPSERHAPRTRQRATNTGSTCWAIRTTSPRPPMRPEAEAALETLD